MPNKNCPICDCNENSLINEIDLKTYDNQPLAKTLNLLVIMLVVLFFITQIIPRKFQLNIIQNQSK